MSSQLIIIIYFPRERKEYFPARLIKGKDVVDEFKLKKINDANYSRIRLRINYHN